MAVQILFILTQQASHVTPARHPASTSHDTPTPKSARQPLPTDKGPRPPRPQSAHTAPADATLR